MTNPEKILIGADPEIFVRRGGKMVSGHDLIHGTKHDPFMVPDGAVQVDGVALEFNIFPAESEDEFVKNIQSVLGTLRHIVPDEYEFVFDPTATFDQEYFDSLPFETKLLGCEPDYDAYTGKINKKPETKLPFRTGAGHIHIGFTDRVDPLDEEHFEVCREIVRRLDSLLLPAATSWDSDETRRQLYGNPGSFRPKHYGVEYRPLSNAWLRSEDTVRTVYAITHEVVTRYFEEAGAEQADLFLNTEAVNG